MTGPLGRSILILSIGLFLLTASILIDPDRSRGSGPDGSSGLPGFNRIPDDDRRQRSAGALVGELQGANHRIQIYAATPEPLYTILNMRGEIQAEWLTAAEVALQFPNLPLFTGAVQSGISAESTDQWPDGELPPLPLMSDMPLDDQY